ncbi:MAG: endolytic transglycosylase MltG [Patescibacteria group bacterium]|nr:endolytic transglycosylase MltG [Patescibacteria group bacterium]
MYAQLTKKLKILLTIVVIIAIGATLYYFKHKTNINKTAIPITQTTTLPENKVDINIEKPTETITNNPVSKPKPVPLPIGTDRFIVSLKDTSANIASNLFDQGYINDKNSFISLISGIDGKSIILPGGYKISKEMNPSQLVQVLRGKAYMKWIVIPEGLRKEEIATILADTLGWTAKQKDEWIKTDTATKPEYIEGVYSPDTYLIPVDESPALVATRLISKFNEKFAPYLSLFTSQNIKWTTGLTLASIVQRESANDADAPLIAGILWNRLHQNMKLEVDATLQYVRGNTGNGWWAPISIADKKIDSPYNTYMHTGLPPHPISNPGIPAIEAVLNPTKTDCLYYLHDKNHITHCAATYDEHLANIDKYLKNNS